MPDPHRFALASRDRFRQAAVTSIRRTGAATLGSAVVGLLPVQPADDQPTVATLGPPRGRDTAILAHFDALGEWRPADHFLAQALIDYGFNLIVVSTSSLSASDLADKVPSATTAVIVRRNVGFDFLSWRTGLDYAGRIGALPGRVVLTNTSVFGPLYSLDAVFTRFADTDVWGMVESLDLARHVESWWLGFSPSVVADASFARYWSRIRPARNKWTTILAHELTWASRVSPGTSYSVQASVADHGCQRRPSTFCWRELIADYGVPFLKRSLFGINHDRIDMTGWQDFLRRTAPDYDLNLIAQQ